MESGRLDHRPAQESPSVMSTGRSRELAALLDLKPTPLDQRGRPRHVLSGLGQFFIFKKSARPSAAGRQALILVGSSANSFSSYII